MIINAENLILGRFATVAAKKALQGESITIINCEKAVITGNRYRIYSDYKQKRDRGTFKGPFILRLPERLVKRTIRGMIPYKQEKGKKAFKNIMCYRGIPKEFSGKDYLSLPAADMSKLKSQEYISVAELCKNLGAKI